MTYNQLRAVEVQKEYKEVNDQMLKIILPLQ